MKKYIPFLLYSILFVQSVYAYNVEKFVFITLPQTVLPNTLSKEITTQSQNNNGSVESVTETFDLKLESQSPTGLFLGSTGKPASKTMSKNTANKTFYYKDSATGDFAITVIATGRDSGKSFKISQNIKIGQPTEIIKTPPVTKIISSQNQNIKPKVQITTSQNTDVLKEATSSVIFTAPEQKSFISRVLTLPVRFFDFIKHLFVEG